MREPVPAMQPLHPDKPPAPIEPGAIWAKRASGKTIVNRPTCKVLGYHPQWRAPVCIMHKRGPCAGLIEYKTERVFRRDWEPT